MMLEEKIKNQKALKRIIAALKKKGKTIVFTNGCFDLIHYGHVKYLEEAKKKGDILIVAVNSDKSVREIKGKKRPVINQYDRARVVAALESVDYVTIFGEDTPLKIIKSFNPDVLIKGGDWNKSDIIGADVVLRSKGKVLTIPFVKNKSSSCIIDKIRH